MDVGQYRDPHEDSFAPSWTFFAVTAASRREIRRRQSMSRRSQSGGHGGGDCRHAAERLWLASVRWGLACRSLAADE
jgi:hypothetical protein